MALRYGARASALVLTALAAVLIFQDAPAFPPSSRDTTVFDSHRGCPLIPPLAFRMKNSLPMCIISDRPLETTSISPMIHPYFGVDQRGPGDGKDVVLAEVAKQMTSIALKPRTPMPIVTTTRLVYHAARRLAFLLIFIAWTMVVLEVIVGIQRHELPEINRWWTYLGERLRYRLDEFLLAMLSANNDLQETLNTEFRRVRDLRGQIALAIENRLAADQQHREAISLHETREQHMIDRHLEELDVRAASHERDLEDLGTRAREELQRLTEDHAAQRQALAQEHQEKVLALEVASQQQVQYYQNELQQREDGFQLTLTATKQEHAQEVEALRCQLDAVTREKDDARSLVEGLSDAYSALHTRLDNALTEHAGAVRQHEESMESTDRQHAEEILLLTSQVTKLQQDESDILERFDQANLENEVLVHSLRSELVAAHTLSATTIADISLQNDNLQLQIITLEDDSTRLALDNAEETLVLKRQIVELRREKSDISARFDQANLDHQVITHNLRSELDAANTQSAVALAHISLQNNNLQSQLATLESENRQLALDNAEETSSFKLQVANLQCENSDISARFDQAHLENQIITHNLRSELETANIQSATTLASISLRNDDLQSQANVLQHENMRLTLDITELTTKLRSAEDDLQLQRDTRAANELKLQEELDTIAQGKNILQAEYETTRRHLINVKQEYDQHMDIVLDGQKIAKEMHERTKADLEASQTRNQKVSTRLESLQASFQEQYTKSRDLWKSKSDKIRRLEAKLRDQEAAHQTALDIEKEHVLELKMELAVAESVLGTKEQVIENMIFKSDRDRDLIEKAEREARVADRRASKYAAELAAIQEHAAELEQSQSSALESQTESQLPSVLVTQRILYTIPELSEATICFLTNTKTTDVNDILAPISPNRRFLEPVSPFAELLPSPTPASNVALPTFDNLPLPSRARSDSPPVRTLSPAFEDLDTQTFEPDQYGLHSIHGPLTTYLPSISAVMESSGLMDVSNDPLSLDSSTNNNVDHLNADEHSTLLPPPLTPGSPNTQTHIWFASGVSTTSSPVLRAHPSSLFGKQKHLFKLEFAAGMDANSTIHRPSAHNSHPPDLSLPDGSDVENFDSHTLLTRTNADISELQPPLLPTRLHPPTRSSPVPVLVRPTSPTSFHSSPSSGSAHSLPSPIPSLPPLPPTNYSPPLSFTSTPDISLEADDTSSYSLPSLPPLPSPNYSSSFSYTSSPDISLEISNPSSLRTDTPSRPTIVTPPLSPCSPAVNVQRQTEHTSTAGSSMRSLITHRETHESFNPPHSPTPSSSNSTLNRSDTSISIRQILDAESRLYSPLVGQRPLVPPRWRTRQANMSNVLRPGSPPPVDDVAPALILDTPFGM